MKLCLCCCKENRQKNATQSNNHINHIYNKQESIPKLNYNTKNLEISVGPSSLPPPPSSTEHQDKPVDLNNKEINKNFELKQSNEDSRTKNEKELNTNNRLSLQYFSEIVNEFDYIDMEALRNELTITGTNTNCNSVKSERKRFLEQLKKNENSNNNYELEPLNPQSKKITV